MISKIFSAAHSGLHCQIIEVESDISRHLPSFTIVGLPDTAVQEARERIRSAIENSGLPFPRTKVIVNLAPADVRKEGSFYDLAIAVSILAAQSAIQLTDDDKTAVFLGELSLSGAVRPVRGVLVALAYLKEMGITRAYVPLKNKEEASYASGVTVFPAATLAEIAAHLRGEEKIEPATVRVVRSAERSKVLIDFSDIVGQQHAKRALEVAAAGGHNVILTGVQGSGKSMLAKGMVSILPDMNDEEILEVSKIYSCAGLLLQGSPLITVRPFRSPHHTASAVSVVGGGTWPRPGEITLAHRGVLFFDELPEFPRGVLEALRQPLEDRIVTISRALSTLQFPAHFIFVAAQNPCPCGAWGDSEKRCVCSEYERRRYERKISGPLLDRVDLHVRVYSVNREKLISDEQRESSSIIRGRVTQARARQYARYGRGTATNGEADLRLLKKHCVLDAAMRELLLEASQKLQLSARSFYKVIRVARTIADLADRELIHESDLLEALQYRFVDAAR